MVICFAIVHYALALALLASDDIFTGNWKASSRRLGDKMKCTAYTDNTDDSDSRFLRMRQNSGSQVRVK